MQKIIGRKPVLEALLSGIKIDRIILLYGISGEIVQKILTIAEKRNIKVSRLSKEKFTKHAGCDVNQGILAYKQFINYIELENLIDKAKQSKFPLLILLDSIQDTHNLGAILRTAEASAADGIIITKHNSAPLGETVEKTSAGAVSHLNICQVSNLNHAIKKLKENEYWIVGTSLDNSQNYTSVDYRCPIALILGNEEKGIHRLIAENCDFLVNIPMKGKIQSLNVSVSAGIMLFEILRQRDKPAV